MEVDVGSVDVSHCQVYVLAVAVDVGLRECRIKVQVHTAQFDERLNRRITEDGCGEFPDAGAGLNLRTNSDSCYVEELHVLIHEDEQEGVRRSTDLNALDGSTIQTDPR